MSRGVEYWSIVAGRAKLRPRPVGDNSIASSIWDISQQTLDSPYSATPELLQLLNALFSVQYQRRSWYLGGPDLA